MHHLANALQRLSGVLHLLHPEHGLLVVPPELLARKRFLSLPSLGQRERSRKSKGVRERTTSWMRRVPSLNSRPRSVTGGWPSGSRRVLILRESSAARGSGDRVSPALSPHPQMPLACRRDHARQRMESCNRPLAEGALLDIFEGALVDECGGGGGIVRGKGCVGELSPGCSRAVEDRVCALEEGLAVVVAEGREGFVRVGRERVEVELCEGRERVGRAVRRSRALPCLLLGGRGGPRRRRRERG